ncbi:hypothetical protein A3770_06p41990 [Chloropicon primus]|uniref:Uncharacterized protein n=3 Tax=Chloropicon primus TaxID=1764295 RepID=A0A5B8MN21_9CHLO|nr:hypothetical protein A3770_06p41990 [Chloropicon primus]|eukprot:QDZ21681.1 hypothetical protein A3770_06p41990 [Chloropicon primus]
MADRPLSVHVRAASLVWKKLKLAGMNKDTRAALESDKENAPKSTLRNSEYNAMRDLDKYMKIVGTVIPGHPSYRRRKEDADIKELENRMVEVRQLAKRLSARSPIKVSENAGVLQESNTYSKAYLTESSQNSRARVSTSSPEGERTTSSSSGRRGKVQEARVRAKIAALASRKALNRTKSGPAGRAQSGGMQEAHAESHDEVGDDKFVVETARVRDSSNLTPELSETPLSGTNTCASTPGMTNISHFLFSSNSKSSMTHEERGEEPTIQKPAAGARSSPADCSDSVTNMSERRTKLIDEVDYVSIRHELIQLNRKFTDYWMRTSEGCSAMTELIQNVKDDSQQVHNALAHELEQVSKEMNTSASKVEKVEHKVDGLEVKFDAMNNVLSSNLKTLCSIAMSKEEEAKNESPAKEPRSSTSEDDRASEGARAAEERYQKLTSTVEAKIGGLESKLASAVEGLKAETEDDIQSKLDLRFGNMKGDLDRCIEATTVLSSKTASSEQLAQLANTVDEKVGSLETRLSSHLSRAIENLEYFKEHSLGSQLNSKMTELRQDLMAEIARASEHNVSVEKVGEWNQYVDEKVENLEERLVREIQHNAKLVDQNEKVLESELDTRFSECKKEIMQSAVRSEQLLSLRQTVDQSLKNVEQRLTERFAAAIEESQGTVNRAMDEKWAGLKTDLISTSSTEDEYLDIMHKMSEKIKQLDSKCQEVLLTSENGLEWVQEKQTDFMKQVKGEIDSRLEVIESKASALQSSEDVVKTINESLQPVDAKVNEMMSQVELLETDTALKVEAVEAKAITIEEKCDSLRADCEKLSKQVMEQGKDRASDEELTKIQNAQRDLYCGLYCTSKVLKEKILSVESKLETMSVANASRTSEGEEDERLEQMAVDVEDLQKQVNQLEVSLESNAEEVRCDLTASFQEIQSHIMDRQAETAGRIEGSLSKIAKDAEETEARRELEFRQMEEKFDQFKRHFEKRLVDHKKVLEQRLRDATANTGANDGGSTPTKRGSARPRAVKKNVAKVVSSEESELHKKCLEAVMKQMKVHGDKLGELEMKQNEAVQNTMQTLEPKMDDVNKILCQKDGKMQAKELIKVLTRHVGAVEGKMGAFEETIHQLTQSVAVAHAKLADQDTVGAVKSAKTSKSSKPRLGTAISVKVKTVSPMSKVARGAAQEPKRIRGSPMNPRVTHNRRQATPEKTRPLAFY